jgi:hypothetical protein
MKAQKNILEFKPEYTLFKITSQLYCVEMPNSYDLAMLFVRYQEYYESPNPNVRNKPFILEEYMRWYAIEGRNNDGNKPDSFSYPADFCGFNIPSYALDAVKTVKHKNMYDNLMTAIVKKVKKDLKAEDPQLKKFYLIGCSKMDSDTLKHEISHGLYHLDSGYKVQADFLIKKELSKKNIKKFKKALRTYHYCEEVMYDEMTAFMSTGEIHSIFPDIKTKKFKKHFKSYYKYIEPTII